MMRFILAFALLFLAVPVFAQLPFSGQPTNSTDWTCGGVATPACSTWTMPANPGLGNSWTDPTWGTTSWELNVGAQNTCGNVLPIYSRVQGFSENNDYLLMTEGCGPPYADLYDATTTPPTFINRITTTDGTYLNPYGGDANWAFTTDTRIYYVPNGVSPSNSNALQLRYVDVSSCHTGAGNCVLTPTLVKQFSCTTDNTFNGGWATSYSISSNIVTTQIVSGSSQLSITTLGTAVSSPGSHTVTPASMTGIYAGQQWAIGYGTANLEIVTIASITSTTFTATFANTHASTEAVTPIVVPYNFTTGTYLNGVTFIVIPTGFSGTQVELYSSSFSHSDLGSTPDSGILGLAGVPGNFIATGSGAQGGMGDDTDKYFSFQCEVNAQGGDPALIDFIRYNVSANTTTQTKWYNICAGSVPSGCFNWANPPSPYGPDLNMLRMNQHPDQAYITILWRDDTNSGIWARGSGSEALGPTWNFLGPLSAGNIHQDNGFDVNGVPVWVMVQGDTGTNQDYWAMQVVNLTTLSTTAVTGRNLVLPCSGGTVGLAPCSFGGSKSWHISGTGSWGSVPGYFLVSTLTDAGSCNNEASDLPNPTTLGTAVTSAGSQTVTPGSMSQIGLGTQQLIDQGTANVESVTVTAVTGSTFTATFTKTHTSSASVQNLTAGGTGPFTMENIAVKIDTTQTDGATASIWRLGRAMSIRDCDYGAEPHTFVNRNWTAYVWGSNWNVDNGTDNGYYTKLGSGTNYTLTTSTTGTGSCTINSTNNCASGSYASGTTIGACTATPSGGSTFVGWSGTLGCTGTGTCTETLTGNATMIATCNTTSSSNGAVGIGVVNGVLR